MATFNIHHGVGLDGRLDLGRTAEVITATGADLVGLQEVDRTMSARSGWVDQAAWLGRRLGLQVLHGATVDRPALPGSGPAAPRRRYGNALLTALPVRGWAARRLPGGGHEPRGVVDAVVAATGGDVRCAVTHLENRDGGARRVQATHLAALLAGDGPGPVGPLPPPTILLGDLNARPDSPEVRVLTQTLVDAWTAVGRGDGPTFRSGRPAARIDYVLAGGPVRPVAVEVVATVASDHRPVVAELELWPRVASAAPASQRDDVDGGAGGR